MGSWISRCRWGYVNHVTGSFLHRMHTSVEPQKNRKTTICWIDKKVEKSPRAETSRFASERPKPGDAIKAGGMTQFCLDPDPFDRCQKGLGSTLDTVSLAMDNIVRLLYSLAWAHPVPQEREGVWYLLLQQFVAPLCTVRDQSQSSIFSRECCYYNFNRKLQVVNQL